ncbi:MAG: Sulfatase [Chthoniobacteraceae bacterium]|nr:Sulfatase [Chthoniobacteraceae bacterium]
MNRRQMLHKMCAGFGMLGLAGVLGPGSLLGASHLPHFAPKAKRLVFLFMNGGPSHIDTFDPKPALAKYAGQQPDGELYKKSKGTGYMPSPFAFAKHGGSGIEVSETLPNLAKMIDDCCIIRSMHTDVPNHEPALLQMHTGNLQPVRPSLGSWLLYGLGTINQNLPGYIVLRPSSKIVVGPALWSNSFLPAEYQAASVLTSDMSVDKLLANIHNPRQNEAQQREQLDLLNQLNRHHLAQRDGDPELEGQIRAMETAFHMQREAMETFDISREPASVREAYGDTPFARSCLLARRLLEGGVRVVSVYYTSADNQPWDTHADHNARHPKLCADGDRAAGALIADLKQRGLLEDTLVVWGGEFGRTPYAESKDEKKAGRDHHHTGFSMLLAGGGVRGGTVYGATDEFGMKATENPVHVHDLHATILHLMGLDHEKLTYRYAGRDFRLTDVFGKVVRDIIA